MSVGEQIGLDEDRDGLLAAAGRRWDDWAAQDARLQVVERYEDLRSWLATATPHEADTVLVALAMLAAPDGGDDLAAAAALARNLLPGAALLARRIHESRATRTDERGLSDGYGIDGELVDQLVASQLWIEVRTFPWRSGHKVASNILLNTRSAVLAELGDRGAQARSNRTAANTAPVAVLSPGAGEAAAEWLVGLSDHQPLAPAVSAPADHRCTGPWPASQKLLAILAWACAEEIITTADRALLLCLVDEADQVELGTNAGTRGGLTSASVSARVAERVGGSPKAVKCRVLRSMSRLSNGLPQDLADDEQ